MLANLKTSSFHSSRPKFTSFAPQKTNDIILQAILSKEDVSMTSRTLGLICVPLPTDNTNI